jgi:hypothetical protein
MSALPGVRRELPDLGAPGVPVSAEPGALGVLVVSVVSVVSAWSAGAVQSTADMAASAVARASKDRSLTVSSEDGCDVAEAGAVKLFRLPACVQPHTSPPATPVMSVTSVPEISVGGVFTLLRQKRKAGQD